MGKDAGEAHLDDLGGQLGRAVLQVVPVDGQHAVVAAEPPVLRGQPPLQQVEDEDARLVGPSHELDAQLLGRVPLVQDHLEDLLARRAALGVAVRAAAEAPLAEHGELQRAAGLRQHRAGVVVRHAADVVVVDLDRGRCDQSVTIRYLPSGYGCFHNIAKGKEPSENDTQSLPTRKKSTPKAFKKQSS